MLVVKCSQVPLLYDKRGSSGGDKQLMLSVSLRNVRRKSISKRGFYCLSLIRKYLWGPRAGNSIKGDTALHWASLGTRASSCLSLQGFPLDVCKPLIDDDLSLLLFVHFLKIFAYGGILLCSGRSTGNSSRLPERGFPRQFLLDVSGP